MAHDDASRIRELLDDCPVCRQLRLEGHGEHRFQVTPSDGGGWQMWSAALLRYLQRSGHQPTQAVIISQPMSSGRYVQLQIGHGIARAEASSNVYLLGESRLTADHEELLGLLGWRPPVSDVDDPDQMPANWSLPLVHGQWAQLVEVFLATMVGVFGFSEFLPVEVRSFGCHNPCRACSWDDQHPSTVAERSFT